jgi:hypothetical protein
MRRRIEVSDLHDQSEEELETYGDPRIASKDASIPLWLWLTYISLPIWGIVWFFLFWNGSWGWFDRGYWGELQKAAKTTFQEEKALRNDV